MDVLLAGYRAICWDFGRRLGLRVQQIAVLQAMPLPTGPDIEYVMRAMYRRVHDFAKERRETLSRN